MCVTFQQYHTGKIIIIPDDSENAGNPHRSPRLLSSKENQALHGCFLIDLGESLNDCDWCNQRGIDVELIFGWGKYFIWSNWLASIQFDTNRLIKPQIHSSRTKGKNGLSYLTRHLYLILLHNTTFNQSNDNLILISPSGLFQGWEGED